MSGTTRGIYTVAGSRTSAAAAGEFVLDPPAADGCVLILADGVRVTSSAIFFEAVEELIGDHR